MVPKSKSCNNSLGISTPFNLETLRTSLTLTRQQQQQIFIFEDFISKISPKLVPNLKLYQNYLKLALKKFGKCEMQTQHGHLIRYFIENFGQLALKLKSHRIYLKF